jgi:hypothetical protein
MRQLETQSFIRRYARQEDHKNRIAKFDKSLDEALLIFGVRFS